MTDPWEIGAAVVGTGFIGAVHVDALRRLGVTVHGVVGSSPRRAAEQASTAGLPQPYPSFEAMLADDRVDVVHIASPNDLHLAQARAALEADRHVVCEKPLGLDPAETAELLELATRLGLVHAVNFNIRFYEVCREIRARVAAGELGELRLASGSYLQDWLALETDWNWRIDPARGGPLRAVADIGSHWLDLVCFLTGRRVEAVVADLPTLIETRREPTGERRTFGAAGDGESVERRVETEDAAGILLRFDGGARGVLSVSQVSPGRKNALSLELDGSAQALAWRSERPEELWVGRREGRSELLLRDPGRSEPAAGAAALPAGHSEGFAETFRELYRRVYAAVGAGGPPASPDYPTFADGHAAVVLGDAIARSASEGRWVAAERLDQRQEG